MSQALARSQDYSSRLDDYLQENSIQPLFISGDSLTILRQLPSSSIDCCITSPPYWRHRIYHPGGIGQEAEYADYIGNLAAVFNEVYRLLKKTGSFWLNLGDTYVKKGLVGIPWRVAFVLTDQQNWILRNSIIWNKIKGGPDNAADKLRNIHENIFHFVKCSQGYYYNAEAIRSTPQTSKVVNGAVVSATGVSGIRYRRQIELSTVLTETEKHAAIKALDKMLQDVRLGRLADFRMIIRGQQRTTHSDRENVSGRARELKEKGFYFLRYHPNGSKPSDVWNILPEDTQHRHEHYAPYPEDLCKIPILATCPQDGVVLDPFCGTGTTSLAAFQFGRKSVGIDISDEYLKIARERCRLLL
jgi:site-specific DNA-methyltransferase (adenine-specific)